MKMTIEIINETDFQYDPSLESQIEEVIAVALDEEGIENEGEISLLFVDNQRIKELNREFRNKDSETDVLSFPQYESIKTNGLDDDYAYLGDIVISLEKAKEQAEAFDHSFEREILYLAVHSIFHLLGYDHMDDTEKAEMREREKIVFKRIQLFK